MYTFQIKDAFSIYCHFNSFSEGSEQHLHIHLTYSDFIHSFLSLMCIRLLAFLLTCISSFIVCIVKSFFFDHQLLRQHLLAYMNYRWLLDDSYKWHACGFVLLTLEVMALGYSVWFCVCKLMFKTYMQFCQFQTCVSNTLLLSTKCSFLIIIGVFVLIRSFIDHRDFTWFFQAGLKQCIAALHM